VVLVLNAHETHMEEEARLWMDLLPQLKQLQHVVLVLHAREDCQNDWLSGYLRDPRYKLRAVFMTYGGKVGDSAQQIFTAWFSAAATPSLPPPFFLSAPIVYALVFLMSMTQSVECLYRLAPFHRQYLQVHPCPCLSWWLRQLCHLNLNGRLLFSLSAVPCTEMDR